MTKSKAQATANADINQITSDLEKIKKRQQTWSDGIRRMSKLELYDIISSCYDVYVKVASSPTLRKKLNETLTNKNLNYTAGSSTQLKVIRYVFGKCSEEHTYARSLKVAFDSMTDTSKFKDWLVEQGGPSGIKNAKNRQESQNADEDARISKDYYKSTPKLAQFKAIPDHNANKDADHEFTIALLRPCRSDPAKLEVAYATNNIALTNKVLCLAARSVPTEARQDLNASPTSSDVLSQFLVAAPAQKDEESGVEP